MGASMTLDPNQEVLEKLHAHGPAALGELFSQHRDRLARMVRFRMPARLHARLDVNDVLQDAYLDAAKRLPSYLANPCAPFYVWLRGITANTLVDLTRRHLGAMQRDANREVPLYRRANMNASSQMLAAEIVARLTSPSQAAVRDETYRQLEQAFQQMDEIDREVLALRHFEQLSNQEVAEVLGLSKTAASNRYVRALGRLRGIMEKI
jgi:RNA polymerase sigma-70 factor (ECF subfamily)